MRFSLQDIKKTIRRQQNELGVSLHFLRGDELGAEIGGLIRYYEGLLGKPQHLFSQDEARAYIGDYRLAHCLMATLSHWYTWQQREWNEALHALGRQTQLADIPSPVQLRLALYDYVNERYSGFLDASTRNKALETFAGQYELAVSELEYLLTLDTEGEAFLRRTTAIPPMPQDVATLYNQWAFEAALCNASNVHFLIDCNAFGKNEASPSTGVGAVIKRLCYIARKMGVYYDMAYEQTLPGMPPLLSLTLYGPQEVTGAAQQYGLRLARLCRVLMGYGIAHTETSRKTKKPTLAGAIVEARATVHFLQRAYLFKMDAALLGLLPQSEVSSEQGQRVDEQVDGANIFDSSIEQSFAEAFMALAKSQGVDGWRLEREPEPLLLDRSIFIPDFAVTRSQQRVYVEILGFWTPAYRERKLQKLLQLKDRRDLVLALPKDAKDAFASILSTFPVVLYEGQLSATDVLALLRSHYDDFAQRLASIDSASVRERVHRERFISEQVSAEILQCYRRSELLQAVQSIVDQEIAFSNGIGLYTHMWMRQVQQRFLTWLRVEQSVLLENALRELRTCGQELEGCEDGTLEAIVSAVPGVQVRRNSIFDVRVELEWQDQEEQTQASLLPPARQVTKIRERKSTARKPAKSVGVGTTQGDLWE